MPARKGVGYHGYRFKILTAQGPAARDGARSYLLGKRMTQRLRPGGLAGADTASTGVMSFIVNQDGVVYERDLGPRTAEEAAKIRSFDPTEGWTKTQP